MASKERKYIFVVGGVMSGVGKGIASSSIGTVLTARGLGVTILKIDPYINIDAGTMNPTEHGEVFVLESGLETDQDMGNYERFLNVSLPAVNYMTTGSVYQEVIRKERNLEYKGKNVEVVPDIPLEVIGRIKKSGELADADVVIVEIGGTVGEYQNILFLEAVRMMKSDMPANVATVLVSYLPVPGSIGEMKTKPTQYAARTLNSAGVFADVIVARAPVPIDQKRKEKISVFCNVRPERVISAPDVKSIYDVPLNFEKDNLSQILCDVLSLSPKRSVANLTEWEQFALRMHNGSTTVKIAVVGKYFDTGDYMLSDAYLSVMEALKFSGTVIDVKPQISWINSKDFQDGSGLEKLSEYDGILVPGGFGESGIEGKIHTIRFARENNIPYFGLCYGMQLAVIEYARNMLGLTGAHTVEIDPTAPHPVVDVMPEQKDVIAEGKYGGTMRLGVYPANLVKGTIAHEAYGKDSIEERHRHRYEINPEYVEQIEKGGMVFSGKSPNGVLMEIAELPHDVHPFFLGTQFHPELLARPLAPHPLFTAFLTASKKKKEKKEE